MNLKLNAIALCLAATTLSACQSTDESQTAQMSTEEITIYYECDDMDNHGNMLCKFGNFTDAPMEKCLNVYLVAEAFILRETLDKEWKGHLDGKLKARQNICTGNIPGKDFAQINRTLKFGFDDMTPVDACSFSTNNADEWTENCHIEIREASLD